MPIATLTSIFNFVAAIVCLVASIKMFFVLREKKDNLNIKYYFFSLIFIFVYLLVNSAPLFFLKDSFSFLVVTSLFHPFLLLGGMFLCLIPLNLLKLKKVENGYIIVLLIIVLTSSIVSFLGINEIGSASLYRNVDYWVRPENAKINFGILLAGYSFILSLVFPIIFYLVFAIKKRKNKTAFGKSIMMGLGCLFFLLAVLSSYIFGADVANFLIANTLSSLLFMLGAVVFISSVVYKA